MRERVARAAAAASSAASAEVNTLASKAQTIVSRMRRMRRLCAQGEEATFIVDIEFKRINPLLQIQASISPESWPLSHAPLSPSYFLIPNSAFLWLPYNRNQRG